MKHLSYELERLTADVLQLASAVEKAVRDAVHALEAHRPDLARRVIDGDAAIDDEEVRIEEVCIRILVLSTPVAGDLRRVIATLKINNDLERIADLAVDIAEEALAHIAGAGDMPVPDAVRAMAERAMSMVSDSLNAFVGSDVMSARGVLAMDDEVDRLERMILDELAGSVRTDPRRIDAAFRLASVARRLERIADHATNIAEDLIYLKEGTIIRHRPVVGPEGPA